MDTVVACAACGMDPATDSLLVNAALAAVLAGPWFLRAQLTEGIHRMRRRLSRDQAAASCPLPVADDDPLTE